MMSQEFLLLNLSWDQARVPLTLVTLFQILDSKAPPLPQLLDPQALSLLLIHLCYQVL